MSKIVVTKGSHVGVWLNVGAGDVHVYAEPGKSLVVGHNHKKQGLKFSAPALVFEDGGGVHLQVESHDNPGEPKMIELDQGIVAQRLLKFLISLAEEFNPAN